MLIDIGAKVLYKLDRVNESLMIPEGKLGCCSHRDKDTDERLIYKSIVDNAK